jgi:ribosome recycling factor
MAFKMKGFSGFGNDDKRVLRKSKRKLIKELREKVKSGKMSQKEFRAAKEEIKGYTDVDTAREYLEN